MARDIHVGEEVQSATGRTLGAVDLIVVDEAAHRVTHVVVDGRVVDVALLRAAGPGALAIDLDPDDFHKLPSTEEHDLAAPGPHWNAPLGYRLANFLSVAGALIGQAPYTPPVAIDAEEFEHEITGGSPVWSGGTRLGDVERVMTDDAGTVSAMVVRSEHLLGGHRLVPAARITEVVGNNVHTDLAEGELETLPEYEEPDA